MRYVISTVIFKHSFDIPKLFDVTSKSFSPTNETKT